MSSFHHNFCFLCLTVVDVLVWCELTGSELTGVIIVKRQQYDGQRSCFNAQKPIFARIVFSTNPKISKLVGSAVVQETNFTNLL